MDTLKELRDRLDELDLQICSHINERMKTVDQIAQIKREHQLALTDPSREKEVLIRVKTAVHHPVLKESIIRIYQQMMEESRLAQKFLQFFSCPFTKVGIIGMGLIGGSICKALKMKNPAIQVSAIVHDAADHCLAVNEGWVDKECVSLLELMQNAELLILAVPMSMVAPMAEQICLHSPLLSQKILIIDTASVKNGIIQSLEMLSNEQVEFISTHPMAGNEKRGFVNSQATLFINAAWMIVPHRSNTGHAVRAVEEFIHYLGADPVHTTADEHDRHAALISHLPGILSKAFYDFVQETDPQSMKMAGPGFHSFTRLAHDNPEMRAEISTFNQDTIQHYLNQWMIHLKARNP